MSKREKVEILETSTIMAEGIREASDTILHTIIDLESKLPAEKVSLILSSCKSLSGYSDDLHQLIIEMASQFLLEEAVKTNKDLAKKRRKKDQESALPDLTSMDVQEALDMCNITELLQLARHIGLPLNPKMPREDILRSLVSGEAPPNITNQVDIMRGALSAFVKQYSIQMAGQLECDMKCWDCPDCKVIECYKDNISHVEVDTVDIG